MELQYCGEPPLRVEIMRQLNEMNTGTRNRINLPTGSGFLIFRPTEYPTGGLIGVTDDGRRVAIVFTRPYDIIVT